MGDEKTASRGTGPVLVQRTRGGETVARETGVNGELVEVRGGGAGEGHLKTPSLGEGD